MNVPQDYSREARAGLEADIELKECRVSVSRERWCERRSRSIRRVRTLLAEIDLDNPAGELLPGRTRKCT